MVLHTCEYCPYKSIHAWVVRRHVVIKHANKAPTKDIIEPHIQYQQPVQMQQQVQGGQDHYVQVQQAPVHQENFDVRLNDNFKLFICGPSRCGKTFFVSELLENVKSFAKKPPSSVIYVYSVWQSKFDEMRKMINYFIQDDENIEERIKDRCIGNSSLVVFDDMINSTSLPFIAKLFTVDARHLNMSVVFLTQRMFVNNEYFRQISQNSDYFCVFKNPRNSSEIRVLAQQLTPGDMKLIDIYREATKDPFSYLFINLTQECQERVKYLSHLFNNESSLRCYV